MFANALCAHTVRALTELRGPSAHRQVIDATVRVPPPPPPPSGPRTDETRTDKWPTPPPPPFPSYRYILNDQREITDERWRPRGHLLKKKKIPPQKKKKREKNRIKNNRRAEGKPTVRPSGPLTVRVFVPRGRSRICPPVRKRSSICLRRCLPPPPHPRKTTLHARTYVAVRIRTFVSSPRSFTRTIAGPNTFRELNDRRILRNTMTIYHDDVCGTFSSALESL